MQVAALHGLMVLYTLFVRFVSSYRGTLRGGKHVCLRVYVHPENDIVVLKAVAQWMSYTRFSLPETQPKGIG